MNILDNVLYEEIMKKEAELSKKKTMLANLPKGCVFVRKVGTKAYAYRKWREDDKILTEYLGKVDSSKTFEKIKKINEYKILNQQIKRDKKQLNELKKGYRLLLLKTNLN